MPEPDALAALLRADRDLNGEYGFLSSRVLWKDGSICDMNLQRETLTKDLKGFGRRLQPVVMASFVSLFLKRETVLELGLPIKEFFIWTDDWEYTRGIHPAHLTEIPLLRGRGQYGGAFVQIEHRGKHCHRKCRPSGPL